MPHNSNLYADFSAQATDDGYVIMLCAKTTNVPRSWYANEEHSSIHHIFIFNFQIANIISPQKKTANSIINKMNIQVDFKSPNNFGLSLLSHTVLQTDEQASQ